MGGFPATFTAQPRGEVAFAGGGPTACPPVCVCLGSPVRVLGRHVHLFTCECAHWAVILRVSFGQVPVFPADPGAPSNRHLCVVPRARHIAGAQEATVGE